MPELILHGARRSNLVRTALIALAEKGVDFTHDPERPQTPEQLARHPWGKIPALTHGDVTLYETVAVTRYIDEAFDGPALQPADAAGRARMSQWISVYSSYFDPPVMRQVVIQRLLRDPSDENMIAAGIPESERSLGVIDNALGRSPYFVGDDLTLADCFYVPVVDYLSMTPEGEKMLAKTGNVTAWLDRMRSRDGVKAVLEG
ncbi:MAG: glutathione S-transferase family protein [Proteobacteria bacterium]|nr:glutathione S-transferase family protein [Pseudomonadota bacterium]